MQIATLGLLMHQDMVLLGRKKKGEVGTGVLCGPGGRVETGESIEECLMRETNEELEINLDPASLKLAAVLDMHAAGVHDFQVHVFFARILSGLVHETRDFHLPLWYHTGLESMPYKKMYEADQYWMPHAFGGELVRASIFYRERAKGFTGIVFQSSPV